ncbi:hypothetical protein A2U01_0031353, partial [Trifolium medium]|nr:hypothetical protein [Trifolium medium]
DDESGTEWSSVECDVFADYAGGAGDDCDSVLERL